MRRLASITAFAVLLAAPVSAQHGGGGGHAGGFGGGHSGGFGGHSGGFGGRASGSVGGVHSSVGVHSYSGSRGGTGFSRGYRFSQAPHMGYSHSPYLHNGFHHGNGFHNGNRFHTHFYTYGFRNNCYGYRCGWGWGYGYPWWGSAYYDPWWWWNQDDQQFDQDYYNQYQIANEMNRQSLEQQRMFREEEQAGDQDAYAPQRPERAAVDPPLRPEPEGQSIISPTVLVFRDQHREEVHNYAIVGNTLWNFAPAHTQKIALAQLDVPATEKANEDRGVTFRVPGMN